MFNLVWFEGLCYMGYGIAIFMMTSSNGNIFRITGLLCGEFTGHWRIPRTKASDAELWSFGWVNNREAGDLRCHHAHYDAIVMYHSCLITWLLLLQLPFDKSYCYASEVEKSMSTRSRRVKMPFRQVKISLYTYEMYRKIAKIIISTSLWKKIVSTTVHVYIYIWWVCHLLCIDHHALGPCYPKGIFHNSSHIYPTWQPGSSKPYLHNSYFLFVNE